MSQHQPPSETETEQAGAPPEFGPSEAERSPETTEGKPTIEDIAREAYLIYLANGSQDGRDMDDWLEAEGRLIGERRPDPRLQEDSLVQQANGESQQRPTRPIENRRRTPRAAVPNYVPV